MRSTRNQADASRGHEEDDVRRILVNESTRLTAAEFRDLRGLFDLNYEGDLFTCVLTAVDRILAERDTAKAVIDFAQWVATNRAYNGSDHQHGQLLYNECLNAVLPTWALEYVAALRTHHPDLQDRRTKAGHKEDA